jgi:hypothetical protein
MGINILAPICQHLNGVVQDSHLRLLEHIPDRSTAMNTIVRPLVAVLA